MMLSPEALAPTPVRRFRPYPGYRHSGVAWLGQVPEGWAVHRLKRIASFAYGDSLAADDRVDGDVGVYGSNGPVGSHSKANTDAPVIVIGRKGSFGKVNYSAAPVFAIDTTFFVDARYTRQDLRWLFYALGCLGLDSSSADSAIPGLAREDAYILRVPVPPLPEQQAIAAFLDRETAKIDGLVARKQRLIELLQEKRAALIARAVTKGLDPDAPTKDSGVEWLGHVPAHWDVGRLRDAALSLQTGPFGSQLHSSDYFPGGIPLVNPSNVRNGGIVPDVDVAVDEETADRLGRHRLQLGDVVFARRGEMGRCALVTRSEVGWLCGTGSLRVRPNQGRVLPDFLGLALTAGGVGEWLQLESIGSTMSNLNASIIGRIPLAMPPLSEQVSIKSAVFDQTVISNRMLELIHKGIGRLREYRAALITAAVTGKIDVRDEVA